MVRKKDKDKRKKKDIIGIFDVKDFERKALAFGLRGFDAKLLEESINEEYFEKKKAENFSVISTFMTSKVTKRVLDKLPKLKLIATRSTGYDHIDIEQCKKRGIAVCNVPRYGENTVAEHAFALILNLSRKISETIQRTRLGNFSRDGITGYDLKDKVLGVIGTGRIGKHAIRIAKGFEMNVLAYDKYPDRDAEKNLRFSYCTLGKLLNKSDIITIHAPLTKESRHLIGTKEIQRMKNGTTIINTSRGEIIDTKALIKGLCEGKISAAGLDVMEDEDFIKEEAQLIFGKPEAMESKRILALENQALLRMNNVIITPHNAFNSKEALDRITQTTLDNIQSYATGRITNDVTAEQGD